MPELLDGQPELYRSFFPAFFRTTVPAETKATCADCAMCEGSTQNVVAPVDGVRRLFRPDTKCCTYHPRLPNFLVGALLADPRPELAAGRARVEAKLAHGAGVTPQWLRPPARYDLVYKSAQDAFGRAAALRCPYYEGEQGACTIWPYREAVCSTFFCKYVAGADGRALWMSVKRYLSLAEAQLSRYALFKVAPALILANGDQLPAATTPLGPEEVDDRPPPPKAYRELWGEWAGREAELYRRCATEVAALTPDAFERLMGLDSDIHLAVLARLHAGATAPALPERPRLNPSLTVRWLADGSVALGFHSEYDALALPREAYLLLTEFRGAETLAAVRQRLRDEHATDFADEMLVELHHHRILI